MVSLEFPPKRTEIMADCALKNPRDKIKKPIENQEKSRFGRFLMKPVALIIDKLLMLKIIVIDFAIVKNWFINLLTIGLVFIVVFYSQSVFIGPLIGALLAFNFISGYSFYQKSKQWKKIKNTILINTLDYVFKYSTYLQCHRFPVEHLKQKDHYDIDSERDKDLLRLYGKTEKERNKLFLSIYCRYELFLENLQKDQILKANDNLLNEFVKSLLKHRDQLNHDIILSAITFGDGVILLNQIQKVSYHIGTIAEHATYGTYQENPEFLLHDIVRTVKDVIALLQEI